ncbi:MAG TPA: CRISPR system precrRNA processing endoribonuclease RAMP protein Cas6 [Ktedonobacteraceae bacterium]|jgi:CRISPR-associated endoribonuclease Cas6
MDTNASERLYALLIKLRPLEHGTLMPFSGELIHAAWLDWIRAATPDIAKMLHDGNCRRLFTCSNLHFPFPAPNLRTAESSNVHLPLDPAKVYTVRVTLLLGELFPLFYHSLLHIRTQEAGVRNQPFMRLGKQHFLLEEVVSMPEDPAGWTGYTSFAGLVERAQTVRLKPEEILEGEFASLATFHRGNAESVYGKHYALLPLPQYVFPWLARRWQELAPADLAGVVQLEQITRYIEDEGVIIEGHALQTHRVQFRHHPQRGFTGTCAYRLRGPDQASEASGALAVRRQLVLLLWFAFYTGIGYKTTMGMGQFRLL